jgi:hypothetical protein
MMRGAATLLPTFLFGAVEMHYTFSYGTKELVLFEFGLIFSLTKCDSNPCYILSGSIITGH